MRIVLTGATGFLGSALTAKLLSDGHSVVAVSRSPQKAIDRLGVESAVSWDALDEAFSSPVDAVVHLAGETVQGRWNARKIEEVRASRLTTTAKVVEAIDRAATQPKVLISASGIGFYGDAADAELRESSPPGDDYFAELCVEWESLAASAPCRVALMRFGIILGRDGGALNVMLLPAKAGISGPLGGGQQWWSWVSLDDAVGSIVHALHAENVNGPVNVVSPEPVRQKQFNAVLCRKLNRPAFVPAPAFALKLVLGMFATEVLSSKRVIPHALTSSGYQWVHSDLESALSAALG
jgi:uncharacterized protein (TIGR01777 family)